MRKKLQKRLVRVAHVLEILSNYRFASDISKPQKCKFCKNPATKAYVWAEGRAYIPVCNDHRNKAKTVITKDNNDSIDEIRDIPQKADKKAFLKKQAANDIKLGKHDWIQIAGSKNPGKEGAVIAKSDGNSIDILEIHPVRLVVNDKKALNVGFPFWTSKATYSLSDLQSKDAIDAIKAAGLTDEISSMSPEKRAFAIADSMLGYGVNDEEGPEGWSKDVVPGKVVWFGSSTPKGAEFLSVADKEFQEFLDKNKTE